MSSNSRTLVSRTKNAGATPATDTNVLAAGAGHRRGSYPRSRRFDSVGCDRSASGEAMTPRPGPARRPFVWRERTLGSTPSTAAVSRDVAQKESACSGSTMSQVRFLSSRLFMPSFRGAGHDSAKIVGGGSIPPDGTRSYVAVWDGSGVQSRGAAFDSLAACFARSRSRVGQLVLGVAQ